MKTYRSAARTCAALFALAPALLWAQKAELNLNVVEGRLCYDVEYQGRTVVSSSPLGLNVDRNPLGEEARIVATDSTGKGVTYTIERTDGQTYFVDTRRFDDGVALRYRIPADGPRCIYGEQTACTFPAGTRVWYASGPFQYGWIQAYQERGIDAVDGELLAPPATFRLPDGTYAALTEANLFHYHSHTDGPCVSSYIQQ